MLVDGRFQKCGFCRKRRTQLQLQSSKGPGEAISNLQSKSSHRPKRAWRTTGDRRRFQVFFPSIETGGWRGEKPIQNGVQKKGRGPRGLKISRSIFPSPSFGLPCSQLFGYGREGHQQDPGAKCQTLGRELGEEEPKEHV